MSEVEERLRRSMAAYLGELETLFRADDIGAVSIVVALRNGDVRHMLAHGGGFRVVMVGATAIAHREALDNARREADRDNWHMSAPPGDV